MGAQPPACAVEGRGAGRRGFEGNRLSDVPEERPLVEDEVDVSAPAMSVLDSRMFARREEPAAVLAAAAANAAAAAPTLEGRGPGGKAAAEGVQSDPHRLVLPAGFVLEGKKEGWQVVEEGRRAEEKQQVGRLWRSGRTWCAWAASGWGS